MKNSIVLLATIKLTALIVGFNVFQNNYAQNWLPYNHLNTLNYSTSDAFSDVVTIKTDSLKINGTDTVFYLNKIVDNIEYFGFMSFNPQFLLSNVKIVNNYMIFKDTSEYVFKIESKIGDSWIFDSIHNINAKVDTLITDTIFGQIDSVKYISLSTLDTILLSKKFGIISFHVPFTNVNYRLIGIENFNLGFIKPNFNDFFNFNIGDVFEYTSHISIDVEPMHAYKASYFDENFKYTIISKEKTDDYIKYGINKKSIIYRIYPDGAYHRKQDTLIFTGIDTLIFRNNLYSFSNCYNHQGIQGNNYYDKTYFNFSDNSTYITNVITKENYFFQGQESSSYGIGFGLIQSDSMTGNSYDNYSKDLVLIGCKKGNQAYGILHEDWYFTTINQTKVSNDIDIYPNPIEKYLNLKLNSLTGNFEVKIIDINGRIILTTHLEGNENRIYLGSLKTGVYILKIITKNKILSKTFIKL